jgi:hypothetical protein
MTEKDFPLSVQVQQMLENHPATKEREWKCCGNSYDASQIVNHLSSEQCSKKEKTYEGDALVMTTWFCKNGCGLPNKILSTWLDNNSEEWLYRNVCEEILYEYKCSCKINQWLEEKKIKRVEYKTETSLIIEFEDDKVEEITVDDSQLERVRDYYKDKQKTEIEQSELETKIVWNQLNREKG